MNRVACCGALVLTCLCATVAWADGAWPTEEFEALKAAVADLRGQINEQREDYEAEIGDLKEQIRQLRKAKAAPAESDESELAALRRLANEKAQEAAEVLKEKEKGFHAGWLSLQELNPEISVAGDMVGLYQHQEDTRRRSDFDFRVMDIHIESYLDPYSKFKAAVPVTEDWAKLGEVYMTRFGVLEGVNLTFGKFRQQFGVVNRWHKHALDQVDFPLALREIFGDGGLNQTGVSLDAILPVLWGASQEVTVQVTEGSNDRLFGGNTHGTPSILGHYKHFRDLTKDTYLEWGATGLFGWNDDWPVQGAGGGTDQVYNTLSTRVFGLDCTLRWEPTERMRYRNVEWRSELYLLDRDLVAPDGSGEDTLTAWGVYSYVQSKLSRKLDLGMRFDYFQPDSKSYALPGLDVTPLAYDAANPYRWQVGPYLTWHQSPFVKYRLEYNHADGSGMEEPEDVGMFQVIFVAGPHKHDRY